MIMTQINFSNNIRVSSRNLHLQTNTFENDKNVISTLFDGGRVICKEEVVIDSIESKSSLKTAVKNFHISQLESIELLYTISSRVRTVRHPLSLMRLGRQFLRWNLLDEAIEEFKLALQYNPKFSEVYGYLGNAFIRRGALEEAVEVLEQGVKIGKSYADIWLKLGVAYLRKKEFIKSLKMFKLSLKINPRFDEAHLLLAVLFLEIYINGIKEQGLPPVDQQIQLAKENLGKAVTLSKRMRNSTIQKAAQELYKGHLQESLTLLIQALDEVIPEIDLGFQDHFYLNFLYGDKGRDSHRIKEYIEKLENILNQSDHLPDIHNHLGVAYMIQCRHLFNQAINEFRTAYRLNPEYQRAKRNLKLTENDGKGFLILLRALLK